MRYPDISSTKKKTVQITTMVMIREDLDHAMVTIDSRLALYACGVSAAGSLKLVSLEGAKFLFLWRVGKTAASGCSEV